MAPRCPPMPKLRSPSCAVPLRHLTLPCQNHTAHHPALPLLCVTRHRLTSPQLRTASPRSALPWLDTTLHHRSLALHNATSLRHYFATTSPLNHDKTEPNTTLLYLNSATLSLRFALLRLAQPARHLTTLCRNRTMLNPYHTCHRHTITTLRSTMP